VNATHRMVKFDKEAMQKTKLMVSNLKSTGQSKFALEEKDEVYIYVNFVWWFCILVTSLVTATKFSLVRRTLTEPNASVNSPTGIHVFRTKRPSSLQCL